MADCKVARVKTYMELLEEAVAILEDLQAHEETEYQSPLDRTLTEAISRIYDEIDYR